MSEKKKFTKLKLQPAASESDNSNVSSGNLPNKESGSEISEQSKSADFLDTLFDSWDKEPFEPQDFSVKVSVNSLESAVGYSSLIRQFHQAFIREVAFYRSAAGGALPVEAARQAAFRACADKEEAKKHLEKLMCLPLENLNFVDLQELHSFAPRVAEKFWERAKKEGRAEFESGHLAANISFPTGYLKKLWNIARYLGVRESFIQDWHPKGGIELALVDVLAQSWFQWQYWLEQTVKRSQTSERAEHPEYTKWMEQRQEEFRLRGWTEGHWTRPFVTEQQALEHAVQMADRFNRIFMRTLRQLRDLRRYSPVTINNPSQVNIASDGGRQINQIQTNQPEPENNEIRPSKSSILDLASHG